MTGKYKKTLGERFDDTLRTKLSSVRDYFRPPQPEGNASTLLSAHALTERASLSELLPHIDLHSDALMVMDGIDGLRLGFIIEYTPFFHAGTDAEAQIEGLLNTVGTPGAVLQFGQWSTPQIEPFLDAWVGARTLGPQAVADLAVHRRKFFMAGAQGKSVLKSRNFYPKNHRYFLTVTLAFRGATPDTLAWHAFVENTLKQRATLIAAFAGMGLSATALDERSTRAVLKGLVNPGLGGQENDQTEANATTMDRMSAIVERDTRLSVTEDGALCFATPHTETWLACITVDGYPQKNYLPLTSWLTTGHPMRPQEMLAGPFYAYTNICLRDPDKAADQMRYKLAGVTRQLVSDSPAYRSLMSHLFDQRDELQSLVQDARAGHTLTQAYMGVNLLAPTQRHLLERVSECVSFWKAHGFRASPEPYISLPVWLCSLPGYFTPLHDPVAKRGGLQRSCTMTSAQAAMITPMAGEWKGTDPNGGGLMLLSRRGQVATINVQDRSSSNYNFAIIASTGAGKSFLAQDLLMDFLARGGYAFVIDAGRSYYELCEQLEGQNLVFKLDDPLDLNPFANIHDEIQLGEMMELLRELFRHMAFPQAVSNKIGVPDWQDSILEQAIDQAWHAKGQKAWVGDVAKFLGAHSDSRARDIADQLRTYTQGRFAPWFNGTGRKIDLHGRFVVTEMDDLQGQGAFRNIVLSMIMQRIADAMYGGDPGVPKVMLIDEAWSLLGESESGAFIERAYRTYRKYGGSAGVIMQSFRDFGRSGAAEAAFANSAWLFMLKQKPESLAAAFKEGRLQGDDMLQKSLSTVTTLPGEYSEIYVRGDNGAGIFRFVADPYAAWLFTTNAQQKAQRTKACEALAREHPDWDHRRVLAGALRVLAGM